MSALTKERILRVLSTLFLIICAVVAIQFITKPKIKNSTKSVDKVLISSGSKAADVTKDESLKAIISSINQSSLKSFPNDADVKFNNNDITCQFMAGSKEVMHITLLNNPDYPYVVIINGKNYAITKPNPEFNSAVKKFLYS